MFGTHCGTNEEYSEMRTDCTSTERIRTDKTTSTVGQDSSMNDIFRDDQLIPDLIIQCNRS